MQVGVPVGFTQRLTVFVVGQVGAMMLLVGVSRTKSVVPSKRRA